MKRLLIISLILLISLSSGLIFDYSAPEQASASIINKIELTDQRTRTSKTYWLGETPEGNQRFALDASIGSIHYNENGQWLDIDSRIVKSTKLGWDWEVTKGHWQLLIKDDTSVAVGKDGHWLGFRYEGFAYLDKSTNEYVILQTRQNIAPIVEGNKIRWDGLFYGVNLEYIYGNDGFKENLEITQEARNWCAANPPSKYGLNNQTTYLVGYIQCDWRYSYKARDVDGNSINWTNINEFQETPINFWHPYKNYIVSALPVDYAYHQTDLEFEPLKLNKRFIRAPDNNNYLFFGAKVTDLNQSPSGTIVFDPTVDKQVAAGGDDGVYRTGSTLRTGEPAERVGQTWGVAYHHFYRFTGVTLEGTITTSYLSCFADAADTGNPQLKIYGVDEDNPAAPTNAAEFDADPLTDAAVDWDGAWNSDNWNNSPSLNAIFQELVNSYTIDNEAVMVQSKSDRTGDYEYHNVRMQEYNGNAHGAKIHIEYETGAGPSAPTVVTNAATSVEETTATLSGNITATGGENPTHRGFYWDTDSGNPYANSWFESGNWSAGEFTHGITSLTKGELYYSIASANNSGGTGNGTEVQFLTKPDEPTSLAVADQTSSNISLSWNTGTGFDTTVIRHRTDQYPSGPTDGSASYNNTGTSTTVTGLSAGQIYYFRAWSYCTEGGAVQYSDSYSSVTDYTLPSDPSGLTAENITFNSVDLKWTEGTGGDYNMVRRKVGDYPTSVSDGDQAYYGTDDNFSDTGLSPITDYRYRAWARDSDSNYYSDGYSSANATTLSVTAPTVVTDNVTSIEETTAMLSGNITSVGDENPTHRGFYWDIDTGHPYAKNWLESGNWTIGQFTHAIASLTKGELYYCIATANNTGGSGNGTEQIFLTKPDAPLAFTVTSQNSTAISYSWTNGDGRDTTLLRYNDTGYPADKTIGTLSYNSTATSHTIDGLAPATQYWSWIYSWCTEGGLEQNSDLTDNVTDYTLPGDPSGMVAENVTATSIDVRWAKGTGGDYSMVRRKTGSYPTSVSDGTQVYYGTDDNFSDTSLPKGTQQFYRAWARDNDSNYYSASYTEANETTDTTVPTVTNASGATNISSTTARINGNLTDDGGESCNVTMFWGTVDGSDNVSLWEHEIDKGSLTTGTFYSNLSSLNVTTQYFYICRAINLEGIDWADSTANFTTLAEGMDLLPPTNFTATYVDENEVSLSWTLGDFAEYTMIRANYGSAPENREQGYCVYYGAGSNVTDALVELNLRDATVYYSAWSENTTMSWSSDYTTASVENLGMSDFIDALLPVILVITILIIAHWRRIRAIYILAGFACIIYGFVYWSGGVYISLLLILLGMVSFLEAWLDKGKAVKRE